MGDFKTGETTLKKEIKREYFKDHKDIISVSAGNTLFSVACWLL